MPADPACGLRIALRCYSASIFFLGAGLTRLFIARTARHARRRVPPKRREAGRSVGRPIDALRHRAYRH